MSNPQFLALEGVELRSTSTLLDRALTFLSDGPKATGTIAQEVLSLRGNPRAAAAAVFALLGADARVRVDGEGVWSLVHHTAESTNSIPLKLQEWVVVDVETTGGSAAQGHRVIEIGMVRVVGGEVVATYSSLINPGCRIPRMITSLTGITEDMVANAPPFRDLAPRIEEELTGRVFVGHNATFDWRFVSTELERCTARALGGPQLCTLRLSRRILPHLPSRSLGSLAEYFGIGMDAHHRALDDALATAHLLLRLIDLLQEREVHDWAGLERFFQSKKKRRRRSALPRASDVA